MYVYIKVWEALLWYCGNLSTGVSSDLQRFQYVRSDFFSVTEKKKEEFKEG